MIAGSVAEAREITNGLAPEHLTVDSKEDVDRGERGFRIHWALFAATHGGLRVRV